MSCEPYAKIDTLYERKKDFTVDTKKIRRKEFLIPSTWLVSEKIDGTNVRISLEQDCDTIDPMHECKGKWVVRFRGRTENSQISTFLLEYLQNTFTLEKIQSLWRCKPNCFGPTSIEHINEHSFEPYPITLYGEGYGAKIQKGGGNYRKDGDISFRLFDVLIGGFWLSRENVEDVASQLGIKPVPLLKTIPLPFIPDMVKLGIDSVVAQEEGIPGTKAEGIVAFTSPALFNGAGRRLIFKLKHKDFIPSRK